MLIDLDDEELKLLLGCIEESCVANEEKFNNCKEFGFGSNKKYKDLFNKLEYFLEEFTEIEK